MMSAVTGVDDANDGKNASIISVAGRSQSSIAAVSIGTVPQLQGLAVAPVCSPNAGRMPGIVGPRHPATYGTVFTASWANAAYYTAFVRIDQGELAGMPNIRLSPGMPATVMIPTVQRTAFEYIVGPLAMSFNQSFRQK